MIDYDLDLLHKFAKTFPESPLTDFIDDYCRWFKLPLPEPEVEAETETGEDKAAEEKKAKKGKPSWWRKKKGPNAKERRKARRQAGKEGVLAEDLDQEEKEELIASMTVSLHEIGCEVTDEQKLFDKLKNSVFAHRVMARILIQEEDWANAVPFAERGRTLAKEVEKDRGIQLKK
jgi:superkiller protein 3